MRRSSEGGEGEREGERTEGEREGERTEGEREGEKKRRREGGAKPVTDKRSLFRDCDPANTGNHDFVEA